jgi:ribosomal-protein-serine acetyltransferase
MHDESVLTDVPMPIRTSRLLIRPNEFGDGATTAEAVHETWDDLHRWMRWAETSSEFTAVGMEIRNRHMMADFILRKSIELHGIEIASRQAVVWCGFHEIDWKTRQCDMGYWVRKSAQGHGYATEATNAMLRYAFNALGMRRVGLTHSSGNESSRRVAEKLGFIPQGVQQAVNILPGGRIADRCCYARFDVVGLPSLDVHWGEPK